MLDPGVAILVPLGGQVAPGRFGEKRDGEGLGQTLEQLACQSGEAGIGDGGLGGGVSRQQRRAADSFAVACRFPLPKGGYR
jgi:hypothetical protein